MIFGVLCFPFDILHSLRSLFMRPLFILSIWRSLLSLFDMSVPPAGYFRICVLVVACFLSFRDRRCHWALYWLWVSRDLHLRHDMTDCLDGHLSSEAHALTA